MEDVLAGVGRVAANAEHRAGSGYSAAGSRLDAYYATMGIPNDAYVHKTAGW